MEDDHQTPPGAGNTANSSEQPQASERPPAGTWPPVPPALSQQPQTAELASPALPPRGADPVQEGPGAGRHTEAGDWGVPDGYQPPVWGRSHAIEVAEPVPLRPGRWVRLTYLASVLVAGPVQIVATSMAFNDDEELRLLAGSLTAGASALLLLAMMLWTWVNVDNSRRLLAHSRHRAPVSPQRAVLWWLSVPLIGLPLFAVVLFLVDKYVESSDPSDGDADVLRAFVLLGWFMIVLVLWARPYLYLGSVMRRIHGDADVFIRWVWVPIVAMMLSTIVLVSVGLATSGDVETENSKLFGGTVVVLSVIPYLLWCWLGWRAMTAMDELLHSRAARQRAQRAVFLQTERRTTTAPEQ